MLAQKILTEHIKDLDLFVYSGLAWLALYVAILLLYKKGRLPKNLLLILTVILLTCEMASNTCTSIDQVGTTQRSNYYANEADIAKLVKKTEGTERFLHESLQQPVCRIGFLATLAFLSQFRQTKVL